MKNAILKILKTESTLFEEKMLLRTENILPSWNKDKLIKLDEHIQSILKVYFTESNIENAVAALITLVDEKYPELKTQPSAILSIVLNTRYVLFSILMVKTEYANISIDAFGHINEFYQPLIKQLQKKYHTKSEDITETISQDFSSIKSLSLSSLSHVGMGIFILDKQFNFIYWSAGLEKIYHKTSREVLGTSFTGRCNPTEMEPRVCDAIRLAIEDGVHTDLISSKHPFPESDDKYLNYLIAPLKNNRNRVIGASVLVHDVTKHRKSEQTLEKYEQYFKTVLDDAADAIILLDENDCIVMWNRAAEALYGWREIEVLGQPVSIIVPDDINSQKEIDKIGRIVRKKGFVKSYRSERITRFGRRVIIEVTRSAIRNEKSEYIGSSVITRDITEDEKFRNQLVQSEKLSAVGTLAAGIAHEIGSPLMSISSLAQMLQMDSQDEELKANLKLIQQQIERISRTVRTLVDFSKPTAQKVENIYLNQVVENVINIIKYDKRLKHQSVKTEFDANIQLVKASFDQVLQVFINLCLNAADAMGGNKNGELQLKTWEENDIVFASVTDNGCGINDDDMARIFEPFFSTKEKGKGTGLGLWVSYNIIKSYGGDIKVESTKDIGTTFTISLPTSAPEQG